MRANISQPGSTFYGPSDTTLRIVKLQKELVYWMVMHEWSPKERLSWELGNKVLVF